MSSLPADLQPTTAQAAARILLVAGGVLMGVLVLNGSVPLLSARPSLLKAVAALVAASAVYIGSSSDFYIPGVSLAAFPVSALTPRDPAAADAKVPMAELVLDGLEPSVHVVYWPAPQPGTARASEAFTDATGLGGVAVANDKGSARLRVPQPEDGAIAYVHYRVESGPGQLSRIFTAALHS